LEAAINASRRGCEVKILLDSTYEKKNNERINEYIDEIVAKNKSLNLKAKLLDRQ
jgi:hypothetical protein